MFNLNCSACYHPAVTTGLLFHQLCSRKVSSLVLFPCQCSQEPSEHQEGQTQRQMESKGRFPAKRRVFGCEKSPEKTPAFTTSLPFLSAAAACVAGVCTAGEHQGRAGLLVSRNCPFWVTSALVYFLHRR